MTKTGRVHKLNAHAPTPFCEMHPEDAAARGLAHAALVDIRTARGQVRVRVELSTQIRPGTIFIPMHWGKLLGGELGRVNSVTNPTFDPISKEPDLKFSACQVSAVVIAPRRIIVIGGGAATWGLIEHHLASDLNDTIQVFGDEPLPFYDRVQLPHLVDGSRTWESLVKGDPRTIHERSGGRISFTSGIAITAINRREKTVVDASGARHAYDLLIIATGSRAAKLYQGHMPANGVHFLRRKGDADSIRNHAGPGRKAVVVGGGLLGLELADALREIGTEVTVLQRSERLMGRQLDAKAGQLLASALTERGITIRFKAAVESLEGQRQVIGVRLTDGQLLPTDLVVFATGTAANAELARAAVLTCSTGIVVDEFLRTSDPAIYAIGEVADFRGTSAATTAAAERQAWHLVEHLRGNPHAPYPGPVNSNILKVHGVQLATLGDTDTDDPRAQRIVFEDAEAGIYQKAVVRDDRLIGIILFGDTTGFTTYRDLITNRTELEHTRATILRGGNPRPVEGRLVCSCNQVGEDTIRREISAGCTNLAALCTKTTAGTSCGSCKSEVERIRVQQVAQDAASDASCSNSNQSLHSIEALMPC